MEVLVIGTVRDNAGEAPISKAYEQLEKEFHCYPSMRTDGLQFLSTILQSLLFKCVSYHCGRPKTY